MKHWLAVVVVLVPFAAAANPSVYLTDGSIIRGEIVSMADGEYTVETTVGQIVIPKDRVRRIEYSAPAPVVPAPAGSSALERFSFSAAVGYHRYPSGDFGPRTSQLDSASVMLGSAFAIHSTGKEGLELALAGGWYGGDAEVGGDDIRLTNVFAAFGPRARLSVSESSFVFAEVGVGFHRTHLYDSRDLIRWSRTAPSGHLGAGFGFRAAKSTDFVLFGRVVHAPGKMRSHEGESGDIDTGGFEFGAGINVNLGMLKRSR